MKRIFEKTALKRILFFSFLDIFLISFAIIIAFLIRFEGTIPYEYIEGKIIQNMIFLSLIFCLPIFYFLRLYSFSWTFVSSSELISLLKAVTLSFFFIAVSIFTLKTFEGFPRSTLIISYFLVFIFCGALRFSKRLYIEMFKNRNREKGKTLIVGAGEAGEQILRSILSLKGIYSPIGFVDDSSVKQGVSIHGLKVLGKLDDIPKIIKKYGAEEMIIAMFSADSFAIKKAVDLGRKAGLKKIKVIPSVNEIIRQGISVRNLKEIQLEGLLKREPVSLNIEEIKSFIKDKKVLVTGGSGSIGSELVYQIARFSPASIIFLDQDETGIFNISKELEKNFPNVRSIPVIGDIKDKDKIEKVFEKFEPEIVFHAAAYKHVNLMELNPEEAVKNNIFGTKNVAEAASKFNTEKFIFISTDKAVNPTSVMGMTKRIGEIMCRSLNGKTKFMSVRFGNVLDSRGSVIPIFKEQIKRGGPVEVTHPDMKRYFMMIPEAVMLVLQAAEMGKGGEVFVLDMGEPIKIVDLARELIKLSGLEPDKDIAIVFTSPVPGEKLFEEILTAEEGVLATKNKKIFTAKLSNNFKKELFFDNLKRLKKEEIKEELKKIISK